MTAVKEILWNARYIFQTNWAFYLVDIRGHTPQEAHGVFVYKKIRSNSFF
jgi:hypothetical protein